MRDHIIQSLLDNDLYKFTMMQAVFHQFPDVMAEYQFQCRTPGIDLSPCTADIVREINHLETLRFNKDELDYLKSQRYIQPEFIDYLRYTRLDTSSIHIESKPTNFKLTIYGPWLKTILFEVPLLAIINESYFRYHNPKADYAEGERRLCEKIGLVKSRPAEEKFFFADFGTRRRFSRDWHYQVLARLSEQIPQNFIGTSNVLFAKELGLRPIGTMAHEYLQAGQALAPHLNESQRFALNSWLQEYQGLLGIALTDVITMDAFLEDFDYELAERFDGLRQDSGDPFTWAYKALDHYRKLDIDPHDKTLVFSDGLTIPKALAIYDKFKNDARLTFGIGTNLSNDLGYQPLDIVIKMTHCNGCCVAKITDSEDKAVCEDNHYLKELSQAFHLDQLGSNPPPTFRKRQH